ncbi:uncharacterized protein LOC119691926 isoform X1 [Plutella xylostella]|uniref:uncharacterized protein LOC119691926 isoform X1 n=1 Tax=Plutella xylostella TaxID=51655 RepID=UPI00203221E6|nr:uncharacterized protein LOC119691926 isoform X1 [Plutella xylostella]
MAEAGKEEKAMAIKAGRINKDGIPIIDVVTDGCWSKRSYKKNYSALSGAAAIIGKNTGKILFLGVKNKYCSICMLDQKRSNATKRLHQCYKNYSGPSTAMESSIIVEGFKSSIEMHGLIYGRVISDGDSSTYSKILEARPYPSDTVEKVECRNHLLRNFCNKLMALITETKYPIRYRKYITKQRVMWMRSAVIKCIEHHTKTNEDNIDFCTQKLFEEIQTLHLHAFGNHCNCKSHFCQTNKENVCDVPTEFFTSALWQKICFIVNSLAGHSRSLAHNVDSNIVECFHSIVAKFVGGKRVNYSLRRGYQTRCAASAVSFNAKRNPVTIMLKRITGKSPRGSLKKLEDRKRRRALLLKKYSYKKRRLPFANQKEEKKSYGENSERPDVSDSVLEDMKNNFLNTMRKTESERHDIEQRTILQSQSGEWLEFRRSMLTASNFGKIIKMRPDTSCANTVKQLLYKISIDAESIQHGNENEKTALDQLAAQEAIDIRPCGLFIDPDIPYLGATPDGLCGDDIIVEVKCPITAFKMGIDEAIAKKKVNFWTKDKSGKLTINKSHVWFYQIQGQLHVTRREKCLFAVWYSSKEPLKIEWIERDDDFFEQNMKEKLCQFYLNCILPELLDPRHTRSLEIRNPQYILDAIKMKSNKKGKKKQNKNNLENAICALGTDDDPDSKTRDSPTVTETPTCSKYLDYDDDPDSKTRDSPTVTETPTCSKYLDYDDDPDSKTRDSPTVTETPTCSKYLDYDDDPDSKTRDSPTVTETPTCSKYLDYDKN